MTARILVVDGDIHAAQRIRQALMGEGLAAQIDAVAATEAAPVADVVVLGPAMTTGDSLRLGRELSSRQARAAVVMLAASVDSALLREAMRAGFADVLSTAESDAADVAAVVRELLAARAAAPGEQPPARAGKVIMVQSTKGGVGKTMLASNIAVAMASAGVKTCLVDLDISSGDVGLALRLDPGRTLADATRMFDRLDDELLLSLCTLHDSGLHVLLAPATAEDTETVTVPRLSAIIERLRGLFDVVVLDTGAQLDEVVLTAIDSSDVILAVVTMDLASVKNARLSIQRLRALGHVNGSVRTVLNRADSKVWLETSEIEKSVGMKMSARIPSDRIVPRSLNRGVPVVLDAPRSAVAKSVTALAQEIAPQGGGPR